MSIFFPIFIEKIQQAGIKYLFHVISPFFSIFLLKTCFAFQVELSKTTFKQGEILRVIVKNAESGKYICYLDKTPYPLYRIGTNTLRTFVGFGTDIKAQTLKLSIEKGDFSFFKNLSNAKNKILKKAFLTETEESLWEGDFIFPLEGRITGMYGERRLYKKITGGSSLSWQGIHSGIDIRQKRGACVVCSNSGKVIIARRFVSEGNTVLIDHGQGVLTFYCHMDSLDVKEGDFVKKGEIIGKVGQTGISTGPHLHFSLYIHGVPVNPLEWIK